MIVHEEGIDSIQIEYDKGGNSVWSLKHGGSGGHKIDTVSFSLPLTYLVEGSDVK